MILEQSRQNLARQEATVDGLRARSTTLLSAAALAAGIFASKATIPRHGWRVIVGWVGAGSVLLAVAATLYIHFPRVMGFSTNMTGWLERLRLGAPTRGIDYAYNIAKDAERTRQVHMATLRRLFWAFEILCFSVGLQVAAWLLLVIS